MLRESKLSLIGLGLICRKPLFIGRAAVRYLQNRFSRGHFLAGVSFATTYDCNFDCTHCYAKNFRNTDKKPLSLEEKKRVIQECLDLGAIAFDFVGGEIGLSDELEDLVSSCRPYMSYVSLTTNGYAMDREKLKKFRSWGIDKINISIDSWFEEEHDHFRNKPGSYKKCFQTLQLCREIGLTPAIIMTVVKNATRSDSFKKMTAFAIKNKIQLVFTPAIPFGKWQEHSELLITAEDAGEIKRLHELHPFLTRDNYINMGKYGCPAFKQVSYITEYGDVLPCAFSHIAFGNVRNETIDSIRRRALTLDYFGKYHQCCLAAEDKDFIAQRLSKNYTTTAYPVEAKEVFQEIAGWPERRSMKRGIKKIFVKCPLCGNNDYKIKVSGQEHEFDNTTDDSFCVAVCKKCGFIYLNPRPDTSELNTIYPENYYCHIDAVKTNSPLGTLKEKLLSEMGFPKRIRQLLKRYPADARLKVIDIGCGNGLALDVFKTIGGGRLSTYGIDFDENAVSITSKKGHNTYQGVFETMMIPQDKFDVAYSSNVIEHVADPSIFMKNASAILKPGGLFLCETPNIDSPEARVLSRTRHWGGYHFPRHWTFFTPAHIAKLGEKFGLEVLGIEYFPVPIFWIWTFHSLIFSMTKNKKIADILFPLMENKSNYIYSFLLKVNFTLWDYLIKIFTGRTALMCVTLRKK